MIDVDIVGQLIPNPLTMVVQLCSTLVLFLLAKKFLWATVKDYLGKRTDKMQADLTECENAKQEAFDDREKAAEKLSEAAARSEEIVSAAVKEAKTEKELILAQANKEAANARQRAEEQIENKRKEMYESMQKEMVEVAMVAAEKLIQTKDSSDLDRDAIDAFVKEVSGNE